MSITRALFNIKKSRRYLGGFICSVLAGMSAATQAATCSYSVVNEWNTGFQGAITIVNNGSTTISGWSLGWQYTNNRLTSSWNANIAGSNPYSATNLDWNKTIQPGQSVSFGVLGNKNGAVAEVPVITGSVCAAVSSSASSTPSSSVASSSVTSNSLATSSSSSAPSSLSSSSVPSVSSVSSSSSSISSVGVASLKALADFPIGIAVNAGTEANSIINSGTSTQQQAVVLPHFDQLTAGNIMKMSYLHPSENTFTFTHADNLVTFANAQGMSVHGHALIWHSDYQVPNFMKNYSGDFAAMLKTHVQTIAAHFSGKVVSWDVVNEALAENGDSSAVNGFRNSVFYQKMGVNFIDQAFINTRAADPVAELYYNDFNIENGGAKTNNLLALIDGMKARGVPIDGVGFQMHVLLDWPSVSTISAAMKAVADRGLKVKITELDVRVNNIYNPSAPVYTSLTAEAATKQKERYRQIVAAYRDVVPPAQRAGITVWGVWDTDSWLNTPNEPDWPLLFDANFQPKPALQGFADGLTGN